MEKHFFTVREANELIPFLTERLCGLRSAYNKLRSDFPGYSPSMQEVVAKGGVPVDFGYYDLVCRVHHLSSEVGSTGCHIKDLESGLVDFPTLWEGREVYLCWRLGEEEVEFWHEVDAGFAGRQPLRTRL